VEYLLRQGREPKELVELGFPKSVITRVRRQLKQEKEDQQVKLKRDKAKGEGKTQPLSVLPLGKAPVEQQLVSLEAELGNLETQVELLKAIESSVQAIETRMEGTPALGLRQRFKCQCGASGFVALHVQCTKCGREALWGWFPK
jgi:ribosomal protein S27AE